ncbi:MAG: thymidylate synthase [bacterium]|nr:thymidylate synthase [bacterium]
MQPAINYLPPEKRKPDYQYPELLEHILKRGRKVLPVQGEESRMVQGWQWRFMMENGFTVLTQRDLSGSRFTGPIGEELGFFNGEHTLEGLMKYGCPEVFWKRWVTPEKCADFGLPPGDLGSASYGPILTRFPCPDGTTFNQVEASIELFKRAPHVRTNRITPWYPPGIIGKPGTRQVVVAPCHGDLHIFGYPATPEEKERDPEFKGSLGIHHYQRSGDLPVGVQFNLIQYAAFGLMLATLTGYTFTEYTYTLSDVHIYKSQHEKVEELIAREPRPFPTVTINESVSRFSDFRTKHFTLSDYHPHPWMAIPTPT